MLRGTQRGVDGGVVFQAEEMCVQGFLDLRGLVGAQLSLEQGHWGRRSAPEGLGSVAPMAWKYSGLSLWSPPQPSWGPTPATHVATPPASCGRRALRLTLSAPPAGSKRRVVPVRERGRGVPQGADGARAARHVPGGSSLPALAPPAGHRKEAPGPLGLGGWAGPEFEKGVVYITQQGSFASRMTLGRLLALLSPPL